MIQKRSLSDRRCLSRCSHAYDVNSTLRIARAHADNDYRGNQTCWPISVVQCRAEDRSIMTFGVPWRCVYVCMCQVCGKNVPVYAKDGSHDVKNTWQAGRENVCNNMYPYAWRKQDDHCAETMMTFGITSCKVYIYVIWSCDCIYDTKSCECKCMSNMQAICSDIWTTLSAS